ncbi:MAG: carboxypeptidase regulatory-like domain-containing protein [Pyrinomonadaceae bacterium]|nr:carboxypeptidase regulatory-like domain-containing protein [Pyrinomonadaceae bacterium]
MKLIVALLVLILSGMSASSHKDNCKCSPASSSDRTSWGHQNVIIKKEEVFKSLRGKVVQESDGKALGGVLVEVYDKPEGLLLDWKEREARKAQQRRIAACVTGPDGQFCFLNIPPGKYELRSSRPIEWDPTSLHVTVAPRDRRAVRSKIIVSLHASQ